MDMTRQQEVEKPSMELILYRMGEMSGKIDSMGIKVDNYQSETNNKIATIQTNLAVATALSMREEQDEKKEIKWDAQKIVITALGLVSTALLVIQNLVK